MSTSATLRSNQELTIRGASPAKAIQIALSIAAVLLGLWLVSPALHPAHVEALSARSQSLAILDMRGNVALDDQAYPVNVEYFFGLRLGTVKALEWIMRLTHSTGDLNFHLLTTGSYLLLLGSSFWFVRRWSASPLWAAAAFAVLTPGLVEISFFFSDSLPSAALACLAIALVGRRTPLWLWPLIGVSVAAATLCRADGICVLPAILVLSLLGDPAPHRLRSTRIVLAWLALAAGMAALFSLSFRATGMSFPHMVKVSTWLGQMHFNGNSPPHLAYTSLTMFFAPPSLLLLGAGAWRQWTTQARRERIILTAFPIVFYLYFITKAIEPRNFLLLGAPFLMLLGATGVQVFVRAVASSRPSQRIVALALAAACLLLMAVPPRVSMSDGPHTLLGRLWSPPLWRQWQSTIQDDMVHYNAFIDGVQPHERVLVVGASFQAERYLHLRLLDRGYRLQPYTSATPYGQVADVYRAPGNKTVFVIRTEQPFAIYSARYPGMSFEYPQRFQLSTALAAFKPADYDRAIMLAWGEESFYQRHVSNSKPFWREAGPMLATIPSPPVPAIRRGLYGKLRIIPLSNQDLADLQELSTREMRQEEASGTFPPLQSYAQLHQALGCHFCKP